MMSTIHQTKPVTILPGRKITISTMVAHGPSTEDYSSSPSYINNIYCHRLSLASQYKREISVYGSQKNRHSSSTTTPDFLTLSSYQSRSVSVHYINYQLSLIHTSQLTLLHYLITPKFILIKHVENHCEIIVIGHGRLFVKSQTMHLIVLLTLHGMNQI